MTRLPNPGGDNNTWGTILNDFLDVEHNPDGTHKAVVNPDATTASKGKVKLAGDLSGTADLPTVPGLALKAADNAVVHLSGSETISGSKAFAVPPTVPTPSGSAEAANKQYVDGAVSSGLNYATTSLPFNSLTTSQAKLSGDYYRWLKGFQGSSGWIANQENQNPLGTYNAEDLGGIYLSALAAMVALHNDDIVYATQILDKVQWFYDQYFAAGPGGLYPSYAPSNGGTFTNDDRWIGSNAYALLALCHYQAVVFGTVNQDRYKDMADGIAAWMVTVQDIPSQQNRYNDGGFYAGFRGATSTFGAPGSLINYKVCEGNIDAIAALRAHADFYGGAYASNADQAEDFLFADGESSGDSGGLRHTTYNRFFAGKTDSASFPSGSPTWDGNHYLDNVLWAALMVRDNTKFNTVVNPGISVVYGDMHLTGIHPDINPGLSLDGFTDAQGTNHIFTEGYGYMALVYWKWYLYELNTNGSTSTAQGYLDSRSTMLDGYTRLTIPSAVVSGTTGPVQKSNLPSYTGETTSIGTEATLWYMLAALNVNPFNPTQLTGQQYSDGAASFAKPTGLQKTGDTATGVVNFAAGLTIGADASLPTGMGLDAPFGTAALRLINANTGGNVQVVSGDSDVQFWANGNQALTIQSFGTTLLGGTMNANNQAITNVPNPTNGQDAANKQYIDTGAIKAIATKTSAYGLTNADYTILGDATSGSLPVTLPSAVGNTGRIYVVKKTDASANPVIISTTNSETIDDNASLSLTGQYDVATVQSDGTNWVVL